MRSTPSGKDVYCYATSCIYKYGEHDHEIGRRWP